MIVGKHAAEIIDENPVPCAISRLLESSVVIQTIAFFACATICRIVGLYPPIAIAAAAVASGVGLGAVTPPVVDRFCGVSPYVGRCLGSPNIGRCLGVFAGMGSHGAGASLLTLTAAATKAIIRIGFMEFLFV